MTAWALLLLLARGSCAATPGIERAMEAELGRAVVELQAEGYPRPYYVSLTATDLSAFDYKCVMGAVRAFGNFEQRLLTPDLRVGGYELDNHPVSPSAVFIGRSVSLDDDEFSLRHSLWRMLDTAYKSATADFLRKQALRVRRGKTEYDSDDLTREEPRLRLAAQPALPWQTSELRELCVEASREFRTRPGLLQVDASVRVQRQWSRLRDSESSRVNFGRDTAEIELEAVDLSTDGLRLFSSRRFVATTAAALPNKDALRRAAREMLADLDALKLASSTSPFNAPALLDPSVAAAVVLAIGTRLTGEEQRNPGGAQLFRDKIGRQVLHPSLTLEDDPTRVRHGGQELAGRYDFDDQGIPAHRVTLVERGILKTPLLSRYPVVGFSKSNGHARSAPGLAPSAAPGTLVLTSRKPVAQQELLALLRRECRHRNKPYGLWVKTLRSWNQQQGTGSQGSIRLMGMIYLVEAKTGKLTLVRDLDLVGTPLALMGNILRAGDDSAAYNMTAGVPVSVIVPSLLLQDAELQRAETKPEKAPILPPPPLPAPPAALAADVTLVERYVLRGRGAPITPFIMEGLLELRQHQEGADLYIDAKLSGKTSWAARAAVERFDRALERLLPGVKIEKP